MVQFILVTDAHGTKTRVSVGHIASYAEIAKDAGCKATIMLANDFTLEVQESFTDLEFLIQNTGPYREKAIFSDRR